MNNIGNILRAITECYKQLVSYDMQCPDTTAILMHQHLQSIDALIGVNLTQNNRDMDKPNYSVALCNSIRLAAAAMYHVDKATCMEARRRLEYQLRHAETFQQCSDETIVTLYEYFTHTGNFGIMRLINQEIEQSARSRNSDDLIRRRAQLADEVDAVLQ